jgi:diaminopimelate epimerase
MTLQFTKMHGLGNDFIVLDGVRQPIDLTPKIIQKLSSRQTGIGFDQCLIVEPSTQPGIDFFYRIFNANGESVGQCGNGARCIARFIHHYGLSTARTLSVATTSTQLSLQLNADETVTVNMGVPRFEPAHIPLLADSQAPQYKLHLPDGTQQSVHALSLGNPHAILRVDHLDSAPVSTLGKAICEHPLFPEQVNVGFFAREAPNRMHLRVYERGCGETQACGSGAVAAAVIGCLYYGLNSPLEVCLPGGKLTVDWPDKQGPVFLTGPATFVYEGKLFPDGDFQV